MQTESKAELNLPERKQVNRM